MGETAGIQLHKVRKTFAPRRLVLDEIDLEIPGGHFHALIGPSGCGKSTLLRIIAGLLSPDSGEVTVDGDMPGKASIGFIFQEARLLPWLTVRDNIALPLKLRSMSRKARSETAEALAEKVGLTDALDYYPRELSGGMRMRAAMAREFTLAPSILLLDEPLAALDAITRNAMLEDLIAVHNREQWTALLVTHSVNEAVFVASRVYVMDANPGRIVSTLDIALPRRRDAALRESIEYQQEVARVTHALQEVVRR